MEHVGLARRWIRRWSKLKCSDLKVDEIERFVLERRKVSAHTANKEIRYLRALFNFGIKREWTAKNPTANIPFLPVEKKIKYIPSKDDEGDPGRRSCCSELPVDGQGDDGPDK
jgi:site-specific recombinase XerD